MLIIQIFTIVNLEELEKMWKKCRIYEACIKLFDLYAQSRDVAEKRK